MTSQSRRNLEKRIGALEDDTSDDGDGLTIVIHESDADGVLFEKTTIEYGPDGNIIDKTVEDGPATPGVSDRRGGP